MAKILIVEDNPDYQELLQNFLENAGHEITAASDGEDAVTQAEKFSFDLLLLLSMTIGMISYGFISLFLYHTGQNQLQQKTQQLIFELRLSDKPKSEDLFTDYIQQTGADIFLIDLQNMTVSPFTFKEIHADISAGDHYPFRFSSGEEYILVITDSSIRSGEITETILKSIPFVAVITVILSFAGAWIFSRYTTRPVIRINKIADKMANLDFSWYCPDLNNDEIGMLSKSINELSDKLHAALDELQSRNSSLENEIIFEKERERRRMLFFSGVSHELKTPIAIVIGQLEGMQSEIGVYKDREKYLARSAEILRSLNSFIKEILTVSHLDISEQEAGVSVNVSDIIKDLTDEYSIYAENQELEISADIEEDVNIYGDEELLQKAFGNIINNGITHTAGGGKVEVDLNREENRAVFSVVNTPAHIDDVHLPHLFEAFYRADRSSKQSSGLGLYITRMIFETYGIEYSIKNCGGGVKFTVILKEVSE